MSVDTQILSLLNKRWIIKQGIPEHISFQLQSFHKILQQVLYNRGVINEAEANKFLEDDSEVFDPEQMKGMHQAIHTIRTAITENKKIVIFGDYDADGVTATALLFLVLRQCGAKVDKYIPNRFKEGYGLTQYSLEGLITLKPELVITVDCGIRSFLEIGILKSRGIEVIVSDHHQPLKDVPDCTAVICPKQIDDPYPFKELAGVGIAYKIAKAFTNRFPEFNINADEYLDLVAIGTIADLAPLNGENRILTRQGLGLISRSKRPGLAALTKISRIDITKINAQHIGFMIAPRLNAAGRMSSADMSFDLLIASEEGEANRWAELLDEQNTSRQKEVRDLLDIVRKEMNEIFPNDFLIFHFGPDLNEGVIGLVASKLCEEYYRPVIIGSERNGFIRASCRSIPDFNIIEALDQCADLLDRHGGHAMAAGFTVTRNSFDDLVIRLRKISEEKLLGKVLDPIMDVEAELSLEELISLHLDDLAKLEPTGVENPLPLFMVSKVKILSPSLIGTDKTHMRFRIKAGNGFLNAIAFRMGKFFNHLKEGPLVDILFFYEKNNINGQECLQLNIKDIKLAQSE